MPPHSKRKRSSADDDKNTQDIFQQETAVLNHAHAKKVKVMSQSGQTDAERRVLRQQLRQLHHDIQSGAAAAAAPADDYYGDEEKTSFHQMREKNNQLWDKVHYTSEAVLESNNFELIANHVARTAESLVSLPRYDADRLAARLRQKGSFRAPSGTRHFDWKNLGKQACICFNSLPRHVNFLYGPLDADYEEKKRAARRKRVREEDDIEEERPIEEDHSHRRRGGTGNELCAVERHMKTTFHALVQKSKAGVEEARSQEGEYIALLKRELRHLDIDERDRIIEEKRTQYMNEAQKVDAVQALFNPQSFTQTVENINHVSFFVRANSAALEVRSAEEARELGLGGPGPVIRPLTKRQEEPPAVKQAIISLNMRDWRDMCRAFNVENSDVPHRGQVKCESRQDTTSMMRDVFTAPKQKRANPVRGMPKTEGLDEEDNTTKPMLVTPSKRVKRTVGHNNLAGLKRGRAKSNAQCSLQIQDSDDSSCEDEARKRPLSQESSFNWSSLYSLKKQRSNQSERSSISEQPMAEDVVDYTQSTSDSSEIMNLAANSACGMPKTEGLHEEEEEEEEEDKSKSTVVTPSKSDEKMVAMILADMKSDHAKSNSQCSIQ